MPPFTKVFSDPQVSTTMDDIDSIDDVESDDRGYEIEWGGFLSNHLVHGQWALETLGDEQGLSERFSEIYKTRLEPLPAKSDIFRIATMEELLKLQGRRCDFLPQRNFFHEKITEFGVENVLRDYLPMLVRGIAGAAMHPIIHVAIGILWKRDLVVAEGLAYLNHSYLAAVDGKNDKRATPNPPRCREDVAAEAVNMALGQTPDASLANTGRFQRAMGGLLRNPGSVCELKKEATKIPLDTSIQDDNGDTIHSFTSIEYLFFHALRTYVGTGSNDYFLLHGLHCAFAILVIVDRTPSLSTEFQRDASEALKLALVATDWIQGCQAISVTENECSLKLQEHLAIQGTTVSPQRAFQYIQDRVQALVSEQVAVPRNEHVYKCAAICRLALSRTMKGRQCNHNPLTETESRRMVDLCAAVDLCMSCDFYGRGIGEKPTKDVKISSKHFRMSQLVLEEEKKVEDDCAPVSIVSKILYTEPPKNKRRRSCLFLDNPGVCPLRPGTVAAQHGSLPLGDDQKESEFEACNSLHPRPVRILNGRTFNNRDRPKLGTLGFELIDIPKSKVLSTEGGMKDVANNHPIITKQLYSEISDLICKASGATAAFGYCHAMRVPDLSKSKGSTSSGYAGYAHSDQSEDSWSNCLPKLVQSGDWDSQGPPGITNDVARRAASASRYAVVSVWRYLGPSDKCRASHLAVLDHRSVKSTDLVRLSLIANGCYGGNYRLSSRMDADAVNRHRWYYYPEMTQQEALVFTIFDSDHPAKDTTFAETPIATCIHSAFQDPCPPENEPTRRSMDIRFLLVWD